MNLKIVVLAITLTVVVGGGLLLWNALFANQPPNEPPAGRLIIEGVEWVLEEDLLAIKILIRNDGTMPNTVD